MRPLAGRVLAAGVVAAVVLVALLSVAMGDDGGSRPSAGRADRGPLDGVRLYVDPASDAAEQERRWSSEGREADARVLRAISRRPGAQWFGEPGSDPTALARRVQGLTARAAAVGQMPVIVAYSIPFRDCGSFSSGGSSSPADYRRWIRELARGIGDRDALVVLEPDATAHIADRCASGRRGRERARLLRDAITVLKAGRGTRVYLDAGNAGWIPPERIAPILKAAGVARADGFALNVANFQTTPRSIAHGRAISRRIGGKPFVVDTSRNGKGPWRSSDPQAWCNPPGRALGTPPTTRTGERDVAAYLWVKHPGASDGTCRSGPPAGAWWPEYALGLAREAAR